MDRANLCDFMRAPPPALTHTPEPRNRARRVNRTYDNAHLNVRNVTPAPSGPSHGARGTGPVRACGVRSPSNITPTENSSTVCAARDSATGPSQTHDPRAPPKCILLFSAVGTFNCGRSTPQCGCQSMQVHLSRRLGPRRVQSPIRLAHSSGGGSSPSATAAAFFACCASRIAIAPPEGTKTTVDHRL